MRLENEENKLKRKKIHKKEWVSMHTVKTCWDFALTMWINFGNNDIFAIVNLLVHKHDILYHLFDVFVTSLNVIFVFLCGSLSRISLPLF